MSKQLKPCPGFEAPPMLPWALYLSDQWWQIWNDWAKGFRTWTRPQMARARAIVLFDRVMNGELDRIDAGRAKQLKKERA